jgi:hypothetical protein
MNSLFDNGNMKIQENISASDQNQLLERNSVKISTKQSQIYDNLLAPEMTNDNDIEIQFSEFSFHSDDEDENPNFQNPVSSFYNNSFKQGTSANFGVDKRDVSELEWMSMNYKSKPLENYQIPFSSAKYHNNNSRDKYSVDKHRSDFEKNISSKKFNQYGSELEKNSPINLFSSPIQNDDFQQTSLQFAQNNRQPYYEYDESTYHTEKYDRN